ncbi:dCMP deaminase [Methylacidimicrobium cyclopophantes]|uniref:tRNA-specific adenosine deaminase n=1 Tax=Methylacidimicrobium cyclopophantes TaxID=1041766 RepID=A0A5E6MG19_9BACT|nr:nucleoside deaminase [Methylacidimicrobium cyclopophantes]VVM06803.1 dCMP deaminase [Methylacidimicrobium cyclopophantes]
MEAGAEDIRWMEAALEQARSAAEKGEVPVGALVVCGSRIVGQGGNSMELFRDALAHAEMQALREAQARIGDWRLEGCTLYVTKEPCPMCAGAALQTRISRIVYGLADPRFGAVESRWRLCEGTNRRVDVSGGLLAGESLALLQRFFTAVRRRKKSVASARAARYLGSRFYGG